MAELSEDTKAIIRRLKDEGELIRNRGINSIKSVNIQLTKFNGVFDVISSNILEQTKILQSQNDIAKEAVEAQRTKEQFDEVQKETEKDKDQDQEDKTNKKIDEMGDKIEESVSKALNIRSIFAGMRDVALIGGGLFVGYNLIKGFINDRTNGGFDRMEESIANFDFSTLSALPTTLSTLNTTLQSLTTNLSSLTEAISGLGPLADSILNSLDELASAWWWKAILVAGAGLATALIQARTRVGTLPRLPTTPGVPGAPGQGARSFLGRLGGFLRFGGAALTAATIFDLEAENRAAFEENGIQGIQDLQEQRQNDMVDAFESTPVLSQLMAGYNSLFEWVHGHPPPRTTFEAERMQAEANVGLDAFGGTGEPPTAAEIEQARIDGLSENEYQNEAIQEEIDYLQGEITRLNQMMGNGAEHPQVQILRTQIEELQSELQQYRNPTDLTFENTGGGRGQIVERAGERQRYLDGIALDALIEAQRQSAAIQETIENDITAIERYLSTIEEGAGSNGGTVIISAPTTVAPTVNNVSGGKSINQLSVSGGGGMGGIQTNPYGIPGAAN